MLELCSSGVVCYLFSIAKLGFGWDFALILIPILEIFVFSPRKERRDKTNIVCLALSLFKHDSIMPYNRSAIKSILHYEV